MKISVFGTGYVGLVTGTCLAEAGHQVCCIDIDETKVEQLNQGIIPIYEPGLDKLVLGNKEQKRLSFTTDIEQGVVFADIIFIAVGTPPKEDGTADLKYVLDVASSIAKHMDRFKIIVNKSTVPVGTVDLVTDQVNRALKDRKATHIDFSVCSNPEFLKEGAAINDFMRPDRIIIGTDSDVVEEKMRELYAPFNRNHDKLVFMSPRSAEMTKYAANAMLATKISFINEIANIAEMVGADIESVRQGIGSDPRIGFHFIYAGCGYGGSCFPKDVKALNKIAESNGYTSHLLQSVDTVNNSQKQRLLNKVDEHFSPDLVGKKFAIWGLAFKPNTDDVREATSHVVIEGLIARGATVVAHDPHAVEEYKKSYGEHPKVVFEAHFMEALTDADALIICTEWKQYWAPDFNTIKEMLHSPVIFDGRNIYDPQLLEKNGIQYYGIGRGLSIK